MNIRVRKLVFVIALCALWIFPAGGTAAQSAVNLDAQAGLGGACKSGTWIPVRVTVENTGADFDARVQAAYKNDQGGQSVYAMDISLPASSRKEFFLYIRPAGAIRNLTVSALQGKTIRAEKKLSISCSSPADLLIGVIADDPSPYNVLNDLRPANGKARLTQLTIADLPDNAQGWAALDSLVIANVDTGTLTAEQKSSMRLWLANGGKLFVVGGIHWQMISAGLDDALPIQLNSTRKSMGAQELSEYVKESALLEGEMTLAAGTLRDGAQILVAQNQIPLLLKKQFGHGSVYFFAADPALQPLSDWGGMKLMYEHLLAFRASKPAWAGAEWASSSANNALSALPELDLPSFLYICCWLGFYIAAIGPLNYLILRRVKRPELAWATIPILVTLFTCLAYFSGFAYRGTKPILNRLALGQGWQGVADARVNHLVGVYSPARTTYDVISRNDFMLYQVAGMDSGLQGNDWLLTKQEDGTTLPAARFEIGGMRSIGAEGSIPALDIQHDLTLSLSGKTPELRGTITNASEYQLRGAILIAPSEWIQLGDIDPQQTVSAQSALTNPSQVFTDAYNLTSVAGLSYYPAPAEKDLARRSSFFQSNFGNANGYAANGDTYLLAWVSDLPASVELLDQKSDAYDLMMYVQKIEPSVLQASRSFILTSSAYDWESSNGAISTYQIPNDGYEIRFQPAAPVSLSDVLSLELDIQSSVALDRLKISLWNFESRAWDVVPLNFANRRVERPAAYVGMDGELRIRLQPAPNDYAQINAVNFTLEAAR